ncbi:hypothetical protein RFI_07779 [Reticulomyxa filosa]|uniref:Uncharacterized protein n=1 Tax=Reticulomyxa filosa TaxID=46433 RepID=X6NVN3_RETFI|nr:hypothetical protein RFI_07779 [Reticulomyxa filosa]|eukprot:ETO29342.1 hypothetical protein RFI_07779 [Reticulomyxa filosa]
MNLKQNVLFCRECILEDINPFQFIAMQKKVTLIFKFLSTLRVCQNLKNFFLELGLLKKNLSLQFLQLLFYHFYSKMIFGVIVLIVIFCFLGYVMSSKDENENTSWMTLKMGCPACDKGIYKRAVWYHASDGKEIQINEKANVRCTNGHMHPFKDWGWDCGNHKCEFKYAKPIYVAAIAQRAIKMMETFTDEKISEQWLLSLCANLGKQNFEKKLENFVTSILLKNEKRQIKNIMDMKVKVFYFVI